MSLLIFVLFFINHKSIQNIFLFSFKSFKTKEHSFKTRDYRFERTVHCNDITKYSRYITYIFLTLLFSSAMAFIKYKYREEQKEVENSQECKKNRLHTSFMFIKYPKTKLITNCLDCGLIPWLVV